MNSSGITRGVASGAIAALAVAGLPILAGPAHAVPTTVVIDNLRNRTTFDLDELRDGDDFKIRVLDELGKPIGGTTPEYRWVLDTATPVEGEWVAAVAPPNRNVFKVEGPSQSGGQDLITGAQVLPGTWTLEARASGLPDADPVTMRASESEITLDPPAAGAGGTQTVSGTLENATDALEGRAVALTYAPIGDGDARIQSAASVETDSAGRFEVTLVDPNGATGQTGTLEASASGEDLGVLDDPDDDDATQLRHRYGPDDDANPDADATDTESVTWAGSPPPDRTAIDAKLEGRSNGARADVLKVVAPSKARGAQVRLFRVGPAGQTRLQTAQLNSVGDKQFRVNDRNRRRFTTYVAKVGQTATTLADETNRRRVR